MIEDGFERVYVELEWYDGPREGVADVDDWDRFDDADGYSVLPVSEDALTLEREQWAIFVRVGHGDLGDVVLEASRRGAVGPPERHPAEPGRVQSVRRRIVAPSGAL